MKIICKFRFVLIAILLLAHEAYSQYTGTGSVSQGLATITESNLYTCSGGRITNVGSITAQDSSVWIVPAASNFVNQSIPFTSDLYNSCNGHTYANDVAAIAALDGSDIVVVDADGEIITAYIFADNYFEMYINGVIVGKDRVPYTPFNSSIARFKVKFPFTIAMHLVDWEENLGLGSELSGGFAYHNGDGGMVAVFKNAANQTIDITNQTWKAQTFYTSPITDLSCPSENGSLRLSNNCSTADVNDGSMYYALHWNKPIDCFSSNFDDTNWPAANVYSNTVVGVNNKPAFTNFTNIFDDGVNDAAFIWSSNLILDNEVVVRHQVTAASNIIEKDDAAGFLHIEPNPATNYFRIVSDNQDKVFMPTRIILMSTQGYKLYETKCCSGNIELDNISKGMYYVLMEVNHTIITKKLIIQ